MSEGSLLSSTASRFSNYRFEYCWYSFIQCHNIHKIRWFNAKYKRYCKCITLWNPVAYCIFVWCFNPYFLRHTLPNCTLPGLQWSILSYEHEQLLSTRFLSTIPQASVRQQTHVAGVVPSDSLVESFCSQKKPSKQNNFWKSISWQCKEDLRAWLQCFGFELIHSILAMLLIALTTLVFENARMLSSKVLDCFYSPHIRL